MSDVAAIAAIVTSGGASVVTDLKTRRVPNALTFGTMAAGLILAAVHGTSVSVWAACAGLALGLLLMMPGHLFGATGAGDVKLFAAIGTLLGPTEIAVAFVYTLLIGGMLALLVALRRRRLAATLERSASLVMTGGSNVAEIEHAAADNRFAYAPAIALGALAAALGF
jgi:prepilin peptidase CpaA